jgi:class 3 adenylate cyclase
VNDSLLNEEKVRALAEMQAKYESVKQDKEISGLRAENLQVELDKAKVMRTRNVFLFIALAVLGLSIGLISRLRYIGRSRIAIREEKMISDELLHNILPVEVADEIRAKGYADVHEFEKATILFTDFKDFTEMGAKMSAQDLVGELDHCFKAFDGIVEKHGIEKIKTIGDAYMAAGGLPDKDRGSPLQTVHAALDMHEFMQAYKQQRIAEGRHYFVMRTGLHTGPVIAGIVGVKKYAYDIWGDTVNVANRMETSGEVAKVNISQTTYDEIKDAAGLRFTPRGAVQVKGKGMLNMYFVERA